MGKEFFTDSVYCNIYSMYTFAGVPQNVVSQSIVLRDSLSFGHFDLLKSKISIRVDGGFKF